MGMTTNCQSGIRKMYAVAWHSAPIVMTLPYDGALQFHSQSPELEQNIERATNETKTSRHEMVGKARDDEPDCLTDEQQSHDAVRQRVM